LFQSNKTIVFVVVCNLESILFDVILPVHIIFNAMYWRRTVERRKSWEFCSSKIDFIFKSKL